MQYNGEKSELKCVPISTNVNKRISHYTQGAGYKNPWPITKDLQLFIQRILAALQETQKTSKVIQRPQHLKNESIDMLCTAVLVLAQRGLQLLL